MSYSDACELIGLTTPKSPKQNAAYAASVLASLFPGSPLRYKVACMVVIRAA